ncbi:MAG: motility associated factor glycosyltransferase family protein [Nitrospinaceae bacterium]
MIQDTLQKNLSLLETKDPHLVARLKSFRPSGRYHAGPSRGGPPSLSRELPDGTRKILHSTYDPVREAGRFIDSCQPRNASNFIVLGLGLGYHVLELIKRAAPSARIAILERDLEPVHLAMSHNDFSTVLNHPGVSFHIGVRGSELERALERGQIEFALNGYVPIGFKPLMDLDPGYYGELLQKLKNLFLENRIDGNTQAAFSKSFYRNILDNWPHILSSPGIRSLENKGAGIPAILVSAGPSLDKNVGLLRGAVDKAVIITVATALKPVLECGIQPDFVVALDPDDSTVRAFGVDPLPENLWLVFDPGIPRVIPDHFRNNKLVMESGVYLSQWIAEHHEEKGNLAKTFSVAHAAFLFAMSLGCGPVILVGQDLAFTRHRLHCSGSFHNQMHQDLISTEQTIPTLDRKKYQRYSPSLTSGLDVFGRVTMTTLALEMYKNRFAGEIRQGCHVYNATEGGVPIPGIENLSLRDVLHSCCRRNIRSRKTRLFRGIRPPPGSDKILPALETQISLLRQILKRMRKLKSVHLSARGKWVPDHTGFIREMDSLYQFLLSKPETARLLQGYAYAGFIEWKRASNEIERGRDNGSDTGILGKKFDRDRKFLTVLEEAAHFLVREFERIVKESCRQRG